MEAYKKQIISNIDKSIETQEQLLLNAKKFKSKVLKIQDRKQYNNLLKKNEKLLFRPLWFVLDTENNYRD